MFVRETLHVIIITFAYRCRMFIVIYFHTKSSYNLKHKYYCRKLSFNELRSIKAPSSELILMNTASLSETRLAPSSGINEHALDTSDTNWGPIGVPKQRWFLFFALPSRRGTEYPWDTSSCKRNYGAYSKTMLFPPLSIFHDFSDYFRTERKHIFRELSSSPMFLFLWPAYLHID